MLRFVSSLGTVTLKSRKGLCEMTTLWFLFLWLGTFDVKETAEASTSHWPGHFLKFTITDLNK